MDKLKAGFTLIELILVMGIIGVLASMVVVKFPATQQRARDTQRRNDVRQYLNAMEVYANRNNGYYPIETSEVPADSLCMSGNPLDYLSNCPQDIKVGTNDCSGGVCRYKYLSNTPGSEYTVWSRLEKPTNLGFNFFISCSVGRSFDGQIEPNTGSLCPSPNLTTCSAAGGSCSNPIICWLTGGNNPYGDLNCSGWNTCCIH